MRMDLTKRFGMALTREDEDILKKSGFPDLATFVKHYEYYAPLFFGRPDDKLAFADNGSTLLSSYVQKHIYEIDGYRCNNLEEVEKVAREQGYRLQELDYTIEVLPSVGLKCDLLVKFHKKVKKEKNNAFKK